MSCGRAARHDAHQPVDDELDELVELHLGRLLVRVPGVGVAEIAYLALRQPVA